VFRLESIGGNLRRVLTVRLPPESRLRVDGFGQIYLSDPRRGEVHRFDETGAPPQTFRTEGLGAPQALALTRDGRVLVGDVSGRVAVFNTVGGLERVLTAQGEPFGTIGGLAVDRDRVFISDPLLRRIQVLKDDRPVGALSHPELRSPGPLAMDEDGRLVVGDTANRTIFVFSGDEESPRISGPVSLPAHAIDDIAAGFGEVFVADGNTGRIHVLRLVPAACADPAAPEND
jgi:sugar lactone lactonase YvrE